MLYKGHFFPETTTSGVLLRDPRYSGAVFIIVYFSAYQTYNLDLGQSCRALWLAFCGAVLDLPRSATLAEIP